MKRLIAALAVSSLALPAAAEPVELVCEGTMWLASVVARSWPVSGIRVLIREESEEVEIAGLKIYSETYRIDRSMGDSARLAFFFADRWQGEINRYNGELQLRVCSDIGCKSFENVVQATCGKADPLF